MARIRTVKPDFFRHEGLQDLERDNPGQHVMLTFAGLWTLCDKAGRFEWKPRTIKLDVLPFLDFDMETTLTLLERFSYVRRYEVDGKLYGAIPSFEEHQRINGKEAQEPAKHPEPVEFIEPKEQGSNGEATGKQPRSQEGKGREGNGSAPDGAMSGSPPDVVPLKTKRQEAADVLAFLNDRAGRNYHPTDANLDLIVARLKEGYTAQQCKQVIVRKVRKWKDDDKMAEYLRPSTLFNREKFNQYAGELVAPPEEANGLHEAMP